MKLDKIFGCFKSGNTVHVCNESGPVNHFFPDIQWNSGHFDPRTSDADAPGFLYIIKEREFIKTRENILKIGKTTKIQKRMPAYPKGSLLLNCFHCPTNIHRVERELITLFKTTCTQRCDIGTEYFHHVDERFMVMLFIETAKHYA